MIQTLNKEFIVDLDELFNDSYERVSYLGTDKNLFFDRFYDKFISTSPEIADKFINTDMKHQKMMLRASVLYIMQLFSAHEISDSMEAIALKHSRNQMDIRPGLYDIWIECLVDTVKELDSHFDNSVELAWRMVFSPGITYMKFKYDK